MHRFLSVRLSVWTLQVPASLHFSGKYLKLQICDTFPLSASLQVCDALAGGLTSTSSCIFCPLCNLVSPNDFLFQLDCERRQTEVFVKIWKAD